MTPFINTLILVTSFFCIFVCRLVFLRMDASLSKKSLAKMAETPKFWLPLKILPLNGCVKISRESAITSCKYNPQLQNVFWHSPGKMNYVIVHQIWILRRNIGGLTIARRPSRMSGPTPPSTNAISSDGKGGNGALSAPPKKRKSSTRLKPWRNKKELYLSVKKLHKEHSHSVRRRKRKG